MRPSTAPAASENYHPTTLDSTKQSPKRRQLAEAPELPFTLPSFRPSTCSTAHSPLLRARQAQRPGTPNLKADAFTASANTGTVTSSLAANIRVPTSASALSRHADAPKQYWALAKLAPGTEPGARALHSVRSARASQRLDVKQQSEETSLSCSSSDSSSIAASYQDAARKPQAVIEQQTSLVQEAVRVQPQVLRRRSSHKLLGRASINGSNVVDTSQNIGQGVSSRALSSALKSLGAAKQMRDCQDAPLALSQRSQNAASHMNGNTVTSCVSVNQDAAAEPTDAEAAMDEMAGPRLLDALVGECTEIMHLFGMDADWFEKEFLPYADKAVLLAPHTDRFGS